MFIWLRKPAVRAEISGSDAWQRCLMQGSRFDELDCRQYFIRLLYISVYSSKIVTVHFVHSNVKYMLGEIK